MEANKSPSVDAVMSLSLFSLFISIFPYLPLSTGGGGGRPNSTRDGGGGVQWWLWPLHIPVIYFTRGEEGGGVMGRKMS